MDDAQFEVHTPICLFCLNKRENEQYGWRFLCDIREEIPRDVRYAKSTKCREFSLDDEEWVLNKPLMPEDFDPKTITE
jgi:hypothetical protein